MGEGKDGVREAGCVSEELEDEAREDIVDLGRRASEQMCARGSKLKH